MIKISPSSLHERHNCPRCIWIQYNHNWSWPWSAGLYPRFSALEENYLPTLDCKAVLNNFEEDGPITEASWLGSKGNLMGQPLMGVDSHGRGEVFIAGEFDLAATFTQDGVERNAVIDAKTSGYKHDDELRKWAKKELAVWDEEKDGIEGARNHFNITYSYKYLPQLASYAYCMENPASAEQINHYKSGTEECWPNTDARYRRVPKDWDNPITHKISSVGILMFGMEKNLELHGNKFHFTCNSTWVDVTPKIEPEFEEHKWENIITPIAQKLCDIMTLPEMPKSSEDCENCSSEAEHQAFLDH